MSGIMQMILGLLAMGKRAKIGNTGIAEMYYQYPNHFLTTNKGLSWSSTGTSGESYGGMSSGDILLHVSDTHKNYNDTMTSSINIGSGSVARYHVNPNTNVIMRQQYDNIQRSTDGGATWTTVHTRSPGSSFSNGFHYGGGVWFHYYTDTNAAPRVVRYLRSTDDGLTWSASGITGIPDSTNFSGHSFYANGFHYLWHPNNYVYRSANALTWTQIATTRYGGTSAYGQQNLPFFLDGYIYVNSGGQVYRSTDAITWSTFGTSVSGGRNLAYINGNWVMVRGYNDGTSSFVFIYTSSDNCQTWTERLSSGAGSYAEYSAAAYGLNQHYAL